MGNSKDYQIKQSGIADLIHGYTTQRLVLQTKTWPSFMRRSQEQGATALDDLD
jgi:hypothetical protein